MPAARKRVRRVSEPTRPAAAESSPVAVAPSVAAPAPDPAPAGPSFASRARRKRALLDQVRETGWTAALRTELNALEDVPNLSHHELNRLET